MLVVFAYIVGFLCPPEANTYEIEFVRFKLRDMETGSTLFEVAKPEKCCSPGLEFCASASVFF